MQTERFNHQVVGSSVEAPDPRIHLLARGQHQYGQIGVEGANLRQYLFAVLHRHVQVKNGQVRHVLPKCLHRGPAVAGQPNPMPVSLQPAAKKQSQCLVVFCDQQPHGSLSGSGIRPPRPSLIPAPIQRPGLTGTNQLPSSTFTRKGEELKIGKKKDCGRTSRAESISSGVGG